MNYTENYHLPQWDEDDRIMRVDFNSAMACIEDGLTGVRDAAADGGDSLEGRNFRRACRLAYNHYRAVEKISPFPDQMFLIRQVPALTPGGLDGFVVFGGTCRLGNNPNFTGTELTSAVQMIQKMSVTAAGVITPMIAAFPAVSSGTLTACFVDVTLTNTGSNQTPQRLQILLEDLTTGKTLENKEVSVTAMSYVTPQYIAMSSPVLSGHRYQLTVTPINTDYVFTGGLTPNPIQGRTLQADPLLTAESGTVTHTFQRPEENHGALIIATYRDYASDRNWYTPAMLWNGEEVQLLWSRQLTDAEGLNFHEAVFARNKTVNHGDKMQLQFSCPTYHDLEFREWAMTLL